MPAENSPVQHLTEILDVTLSNASPDERLRECQAVGRLLAACGANTCGEWDEVDGCHRMDRQTWVRLLVTPGSRARECQAVGRCLAHCERDCNQWDKASGCQQMDRDAWILYLITPGETCRFNGQA